MDHNGDVEGLSVMYIDCYVFCLLLLVFLLFFLWLWSGGGELERFGCVDRAYL